LIGVRILFIDHGQGQQAGQRTGIPTPVNETLVAMISDARWTKKHERSYFGYKNHVGVE
jgi:hypothetical protein